MAAPAPLASPSVESAIAASAGSHTSTKHAPAMVPASVASSASVPTRLSVLTFNLLCPAYKRCHSTADGRYRESDRPDEWQARFHQILVGLQQADADVVCIQEYWTASADWCQRFTSAMASYTAHVTPRTGEKDDGVAVFLRATPSAHAAHGGYVCTALRKHDFRLQGFGNRMGLLLLVRAQAGPPDGHATHGGASGHEASGWDWRPAFEAKLPSSHALLPSPLSPPTGVVAASSSPSSFDFFLLVTHLTFNHGIFDTQQRKFEISSLLNQLDAVRFSDDKEPAVAAHERVALSRLPLLLTGDFNTQLECTTDYVYAKVIERGFASSFAAVNGREPLVTHSNHRGECVPVDFVFYSDDAGASVKWTPTFSTLLPTHHSDQTWPDEFTLSDHRPVLSVFEITAADTPADVPAAAGTTQTVSVVDSATAPKDQRAAL